MELGISGKRVLITGGSKGIGFACAQAFAREKANVVIVSRAQENLDRALRSLEAEGLSAVAYSANLSDADQAAALVEKVTAASGNIDILVNSAGAAKVFNPEELDPAAYRGAIEAKYFPYIYTQDAVLKSWRKQDYAGGPRAIVNIIGTGGKRPRNANIASGAANAALMLTTLGLAQYYARYGIRINAVNPGSTLTDRNEQTALAEARRLGIAKEKVLEKAQSEIPLGRCGRPEEVADAALFLASERASYIVGAIVPVDGGRTPTI